MDDVQKRPLNRSSSEILRNPSNHAMPKPSKVNDTMRWSNQTNGEDGDEYGYQRKQKADKKWETNSYLYCVMKMLKKVDEHFDEVKREEAEQNFYWCSDFESWKYRTQQELNDLRMILGASYDNDEVMEMQHPINNNIEDIILNVKEKYTKYCMNLN